MCLVDVLYAQRNLVNECAFDNESLDKWKNNVFDTQV